MDVIAGDILNAQDKNWQKALDVDLTAVMVGTRLATKSMSSASGGKSVDCFNAVLTVRNVLPLIVCNLAMSKDAAYHLLTGMPVNCFSGLIITVASAGGIFPMPMAPVYATAKSGVIHFTRSLAPRLKKRNIRICALCPQQVDTPMVSHRQYPLSVAQDTTRHSPNTQRSVRLLQGDVLYLIAA